MSRSINLESLYQMIKDSDVYHDDSIMKNFLATLDDDRDITKIQIKYKELETFKSLYDKIGHELKPEQNEAFYYGYKNNRAINQEFDLLKFNLNTTLNIELKSDYSNGGKQKLKDTLKRQNHILLNCTKNVINYAYVLSDEKLYRLVSCDYNGKNKDYELVESDFSSLIQEIPNEYIEYNKLENIVPEDLMLSPYSEPQKFVERSYYLNQKQDEIVNRILKSKSRYHCISGGAGTGKSLVLFDIANKFLKLGKSVVLVFCGKLEDFNELSRIHKFDILDIKSICEDFSLLKKYDVVLVDEFQRVREEQYDFLINLDVEVVVYSVDKNQTLHPTEILLDIETKLKKDKRIANYYLGDKIRQNNEMSWFIKKLLKPNDNNIQPTNYDKVTVKYFAEKKSAFFYIEQKSSHDHFVPIELTEYKTKLTGKKQRENFLLNSKNIHDVVGKEYDNVIVVFDEYISYDEETAKLISNYKESIDYSNYPYDEYNCYFEALTRVRDRLEIVVINNHKLYKKVLEILNWRKDWEKDRYENLKKENKRLKEEISKLKLEKYEQKRKL